MNEATRRILDTMNNHRRPPDFSSSSRRLCSTPYFHLENAMANLLLCRFSGGFVVLGDALHGVARDLDYDIFGDLNLKRSLLGLHNFAN